jgi:signal transduction histidine kinase
MKRQASKRLIPIGLLTVEGQLAAVITLGISLGFLIVFALQVESARTRIFEEELSHKVYTTQLIAAQLYGAVRWRKPAIIQKVYNTIEAQDAGGITTAITLDRDGGQLRVYQEDASSYAELESLAKSQSIQLTNSDVFTHSGDKRFTVIAPIVSADGRDRSGTLAMTWRLDNLVRTTNEVVLQQSSIALASLGAILAAALLFIRQRISKPLARITEATNRIANGDKKFQVPYKSRHDEIGAMARALVTFQGNVALIDRLTADQQQQTMRLSAALEKEREFNALHREFVSMVSHEFRTPVAIIDGAAQRIERRAGRDTTEVLLQRTAKIRSAVRRMIDLIESTLSVARLEAGNIKLELEDCNIAELLNEVVRRHQEISEKHKLDLTIADLPPSLYIDPRRMEQILTNLLSNAVKYSPNSPRIDIRAGTVGNKVVITVRDYGLGIPQGELSKLFERFFRASTSTGIPGTGIGLHLVKHLVALHEGNITVHSVEGAGSTFAVELPLPPDGARECDSDRKTAKTVEPVPA